MTVSPYASDAKISEALTAIGAELVGQTEQQLLQQILVAAATAGGGGGSAVTSVNGQTGAVVLTKSSISLDQVDNTSDANKPVSTATQTALSLKLNLAGGNLTASIAVPEAVGITMAQCRTNGILFGSDRSTAGIGISGFNNTLQFYGSSGFIAQLNQNELGLLPTTTIGWAQAGGPASSKDTVLSRGGVATIQQGLNSATPIAQLFTGPSGVGTNIAGGKMCLSAGRSTGNATPAVLALQGTAAGASGATAQTLVDVLSIIRAGVIRITGIPTSSAGLSTGDVWSNGGVLTIV